MTEWLYYTLLFFSILFSLFILWAYIQWIQIPVEEIEVVVPEHVSIIIPARNEEMQIQDCLISISKQNYPKNRLEIILVDDQSTDLTAHNVKEFATSHPELNIQLLSLSSDTGGSKKKAIEFAIQHAQSEIIVTTDADCTHSPAWISSMVTAFVGKNALLIAGPVDILPGKSFSGKIQCLEFMGLNGISAAGISGNLPMICSGSNLMFSKTVFQKVGAYASDTKRTSGDDTQLLIKISLHAPDKVFYQKSRDAIVSTKNINGLRDLIQQRKRWAGKIPFVLSTFTISVASIAWFTHLFLIMTLFYSLYSWHFPLLFVTSILLILTCEFLLLNSMARFFRRRSLLWLFLPVQIIYMFYIVLIGVTAPFGKYIWKQRRTQ